MLALTNGMLFDGSGGPPVRGDLLVQGDRIAGIAPAPGGCRRIDCSGLAVAPGFIDLHSHSDLQVLEGRLEKAKQGVTTEVVGNCGFSAFPHGSAVAELREFAAGILGRDEGWGWPGAAEYLAAVTAAGGPVRAVSLVGHGSLRIAVAGPRQGALAPAELDRLEGMLEDSLDAGCAGFSTGLMYAPGSSAPAEELERLCGVVARKGKLYATHMRSYASGLREAVQEQLQLARRTGCRIQISHLQAAGRGNWDRQRRTLEEIEKAALEGIDVEFDIYPYQFGSTVLTQWLPQWVLDGGRAAMLARLRDGDLRGRIVGEMEESLAQDWSDITISSVAGRAHASLVGKTLPDALSALELLIEEEGAVNVISFNQSEGNLRELLTHPLCSVVSDGFYVKGKAHPRLYGTFPELLGKIVRERGWMALTEAVHKITGKPAARLRWQDRGLLRKGFFADLTVFDPEKIDSGSTYNEPAVDPQGIVMVMRDGRVTYGQGEG